MYLSQGICILFRYSILFFKSRVVRSVRWLRNGLLMFSTKLQEGLRGCWSAVEQLCAFVSNRFPVSTEEATPDMEEQSGEGSGNSDAFAPFISMDQKRDTRSPEQEVNKNEEEGSTEFSGDIDYLNMLYLRKQIGFLKRIWKRKTLLHKGLY